MNGKFSEILICLANSPLAINIANEIRSNEDENWSWTSGGCFAFAEAICLAVPKSELWAVGQQEKCDWACQHAFVKYKGFFYDAEGISFEKELLKKYSWPSSAAKIGKVSEWIRSPDPNKLWYPDQEFVLKQEIKNLALNLKQMLTNE